MALGDLCMSCNLAPSVGLTKGADGKKIYKCQSCLNRSGPRIAGKKKPAAVEAPQPKTWRERVSEVFKKHPEQWLSASEVADKMPGLSEEDRISVIDCVAGMCRAGILNKVKVESTRKLGPRTVAVFRPFVQSPGPEATPLKSDQAAMALARPPRGAKVVAAAARPVQPEVTHNTGSSASEAPPASRTEGAAVAPGAEKSAPAADEKPKKRERNDSVDIAGAEIVLLRREIDHLKAVRDELARQLSAALEETETLKAGIAAAELQVNELVEQHECTTIIVPEGTRIVIQKAERF